MSDAGIFLQSENGLVLMHQTPYETESHLQEALSKYPEVIAGPTTTGDTPTKLLLVAREMGVPTQQGSGNALSLDHLFLDADGVPVLVEVKRRSDTRIRREVVGQILDYAANGRKYWPLQELQHQLDKTAGSDGKSGDEALSEFLGGESTESFWSNVRTNLDAGRIRMFIVADELPDELVAIIEFLNGQMSPAEVLGVEVKQYRHGEHVAFVPKVYGQTSVARASKQASGGTYWTHESFLAEADRLPERERECINTLFDDNDRRGGRLSFGRAATAGVAGWSTMGDHLSAAWVLNLGTADRKPEARVSLWINDWAKQSGAERAARATRLLAPIPSLAKFATGATAESVAGRSPNVTLTELASSGEYQRALFAALDELARPS